MGNYPAGAQGGARRASAVAARSRRGRLPDLGLKTFRAAGNGATRTASWRTTYGSALLLTLTNPPTIIMFAAVSAALAPASGFAPGIALLTVAGVFAGSLLWWLGLTTAIAALRRALGSRVRAWIDRISGAALALFGLAEVRRAL